MILGRGAAIGFLVIVMCIWGTSYAITKAAINTVPPILLALLRFLIATLILVPIAYRRSGSRLVASRHTMLRLALMGMTGVAIYYVSFNLSLVYTTATSAALIQGCMPAVTAVFATLFLRESLTRRLLGGMALSLCGIFTFVLVSPPQASAPNPKLGNLLLLLTVVSWSAYTILGRSFQGTSDLAVTAYSIGLGTLFLIPIAGLDLLRHQRVHFSFNAWLAVLYLGIGATAITFFLWNRALQILPASQVGTFNNLAPVVGVFTAVFFLHERVVPMQVAGGLLVLLGIWISSPPVPAPPRQASLASK